MHTLICLVPRCISRSCLIAIYVVAYISLAMGVRKKITHCTHCTKLIEGPGYKGYRLKINGDEVAMHVNCVYDHWHKTYISKGIPLPKADTKQHAFMMLDYMNTSYELLNGIGPQP